jgi:hypothetical protein
MALSDLQLDGLIRPAYYPGDPPDSEYLTGPGSFGYFWAEHLPYLDELGLSVQTTGYDFKAVAADHGFREALRQPQTLTRAPRTR